MLVSYLGGIVHVDTTNSALLASTYSIIAAVSPASQQNDYRTDPIEPKMLMRTLFCWVSRHKTRGSDISHKKYLLHAQAGGGVAIRLQAHTQPIEDGDR